MRIAAIGCSGALDRVGEAAASEGALQLAHPSAAMPSANAKSRLVGACKICFDSRGLAAIRACLARLRGPRDHARHRARLGFDVEFALGTFAPGRKHET